MAEKLLETFDDDGITGFIFRGSKVTNMERVSEILSINCNPYFTKDNGGVIVYFSKEEFEKLKKDYDIKG